jgi:hypothetical protein
MSDPIEFAPPWLVAQVDQKITFMTEHGALDMARESGAMLVMSFLDEGSPDMTDAEREVWERTCDHCGKYVPDEGPETFYTGHVVRFVEDVQIILAYGICGTCKTNQKGTEDV